MMKKYYIKPLLDVASILTCQFIATSDQPLEDEETTPVQHAKGDYASFDDDDDE